MTGANKIIILGAGGHAKVLLDALQHYDLEVIAIAAPHKSDSQTLSRIKHLVNDEEIFQFNANNVGLVNAIGSTTDTKKRYELFHKFKIHGYHFVSIQHPASTVSQMDMEIGEGFQAMAGSIVNASVSLGQNVLVNTQAVVEHDSTVGAHTHIASGAVICGGCLIGEMVHVGAGAVIKQGISIGSGSVIASGAVVIEDVQPFSLVAGVPAKVKRQLHSG